MAANLQPISSDGGFTSGGNININNGSDIVTAINEDLNIIVQDEEDDGWSLKQTITDGIGNNLSQTTLDSSSFLIELGSDQWQFDGNTLQVTTDSTIRGFNTDVVVQSLVSGGNPVASLQVVNGVNDPNIFSTFDATSTGANIKVYNGGSNGGVGHFWQFDNGGNLTFPRDDANGDPILRITGGTNPRILSEDASLAGPANLEITALNTIFTGSSGSAIKIYPDDGEVASDGNLQIWSNTVGNTQYSWTFGDDGNLTLPGNTFAVNYANGTQVPLGGGGGNTGNVTFDNVTVQGVNQLNLSWDPLATANLAYLQVRGGDVASHIHFDTGNNNAYDLIVGDDQKFVQVSSTGNIIMSSYDGNTSHIMTLDTTGNLILAGGNSIVRSVANSSLDPVNPNVSTMIFTPDSGYSSQSLVLDPTSPGHIHLRAPGTNIEEPLANIFLGGENSSFEVGVYNGSAPNVFIHSGGNTWTFVNDGNLTTPSNLVISPSGLGTGTAIVQSNAPLVLASSEANGKMSLSWFENPTGPGNIVQVGLNDSTAGSMTVLTGDFANTTYVWNFDNTGNLTTPGSILPDIANTLDLGNGSNYFRDAYFSGNVLADTLVTSDGGITHTGTAVGINANAGKDIYLVADGGNASWTFDTAGNLTLPGNTFSINFANGSQAALSSIANGNSNVSIATANGNVTIAAVGNTTMTVTGTGANITGTLNATGNVTAQGTGSNLIRRAFGLVAADTNVTLDGFSAQVTSSSNQLSISWTGGYQITGWTETYTGGSAAVQNWVNLSSPYTFASGAMNSQGNGCRAIFSDQTPSATVYQVTVVRSGTTGALWNISIERLV
jgi:hypothetical protein